MITPFDDALQDLRIAGSVLLHETYYSPWAIDVPAEDALRRMLAVGSDVRVVPFHLVRRGAFAVSTSTRAPVAIATHEVAICPSGEPHQMSAGRHSPAVPIADVLRRLPSGRSLTRARPGAECTELICGVFLMRATPLNPMLTALPPVMKVRTAGPDANPMLVRVAEMLGEEVARGHRGGYTASRLLELFCAEAIGEHRRSAGQRTPGWFKALDDPRIGQAMQQIHRRPGHAWTVAALAESAGLSPSRFAACFRETTGESAMAYVAQWRMTVACRMLRETDRGLAEVANEVGYQDVAAFSRAFKALVGESPARWRAAVERERPG